MHDKATEAPASVPPLTSMPPTARETRDMSTLPVGPIMCFACVTATCRHSGCGGMIPVLTYFEGTALCMDCAAATVDGLGRRR